ncbi:hypothetical protein M422DRAFT_42648 [Sphaerobolus stellatus SS14]|nr:hypothetical protein M422DRAFT_42648 [Sphaerobolus stellatus SS14]
MLHSTAPLSNHIQEDPISIHEAPDDDSIASSRPASPCFYSSENHDKAYDNEVANCPRSPIQETTDLIEQGDRNPRFDEDQRRQSNGLVSLDEPVPGLTSLFKHTNRVVSVFPYQTSKADFSVQAPMADSRRSDDTHTDCNLDGSQSNRRSGSGDSLGNHTENYRSPFQKDTGLSVSSILASLPHELPVLDPTRIRPSLRMTPEEFSEAKLLILDLLGWGVPLDYLIHHEIGRESLYYAFTELNLRLPKDFDIDGIERFEPPPTLLTSL